MTYDEAITIIGCAHTDNLPAILRAHRGECVEETIAYAEAIQSQTDDNGELTVGADRETMTARKADLLAALEIDPEAVE